MSIQQKLKHELKAIVLVTLFFAAWLGILMGIKVLILEGYQIHFGSLSAVLIGALVLAKVVLILEHVSLGAWLRDKPVLFDVVLRTLLYAFGTSEPAVWPGCSSHHRGIPPRPEICQDTKEPTSP